MNHAHNEALPITPKLTPPKWKPGNHIPTCACKPCRHAYAIMCPDCGLGQTRTNTVRINETWSEWLCWECGHRFGGIIDEGELDIGLIRDSQLNTNPWTNPFTEEPNP